MDEPHRLTLASYLKAWIALLLLTGLSLLASFAALGVFETAVALAIAAIKATVVVLVFMHVFEGTFPIKMVAMLNALWIIILCLGVIADVAAR